MFLFFNDTATTEIYTLSLHDALPIYVPRPAARAPGRHRHQRPVQRQQRQQVARLLEAEALALAELEAGYPQDRKSTRLNSSHANISYAVFCLKKKTTQQRPHTHNEVE